MQEQQVIAIQDLYPEDLAHCFGCGKNNNEGYQLKTYRVGEETISTFFPDKQYTALPGAVYGGLLASLLDCHGTASAAAFLCEHEDLPLHYPLQVRCVTGNLNVSFKALTPIGVPLTIRGRLKAIAGRKVTVEMTLLAKDKVCVTAEILAIRLKE